MRPSTGFVLCLFVIGAALSACATPAPLVRLYPSSQEVVWVSGRASIVREQNGVWVAAAFEHQDGGSLGLHVEVKNQSGAQLDLNPRELTFTACRGPRVDSCAPTRRVIDPEQVLATLDERQSRERADAVNTQAALGTLVILTAVGEVATVASGHANGSTGDAMMGSALLMQSTAAAYDSSLASIAMQQQIWSTEALRRTTLFPGRGAAGRIYLPIDLDAQIVWLHVRAGGLTFSFPFKQTVTELAPVASRNPGASGNGLNR